MEIQELRQIYEKKKIEIKNRILEFKQIINEPEEKIFSELSFCLCTPQSKAKECDKAIKTLEKNNMLFIGNERQIQAFLSNIRFNESKSRYIVNARNFFTSDSKITIKDKLSQFKTSQEAREWLIENIKGLGYKEASHFLRNIGLGDDLAILDRHILRCLLDFQVINEIPKSLTPKKYLEIEQKMKDFAKHLDIPFADLDLLLFYRQTGEIFK